MWSKLSGECVRTFTEHTKPVTAVHMNASSNCIVSASLDGIIKVRYWDCNS